MDMHNTNDTRTNDDTSSNSNSGAALDHIRDAIRIELKRAQGAGLETLECFREIGRGLNEAKEIQSGTKGAFGKWCDDNFQFSKEWRARLMKLADRWKDFLAAKEWDEAQGRLLGRKEYSVDGALAFINEWHKAMNPAPEGEGEGAEGEGEGGESEPKQKKETAAEKLRRELAEALERIRLLEEELRKARGEKKAEGAKAEGAKAKRNPIDAATRTRAAKVWALYQRGSTDGEKAAAKARLEDIAAKFEMDFEAFCKACNFA